MLIDSTYFQGEINVAQLSQPSVEETLVLFITKYETKCLNEVLGYSFAKLFKTSIEADPVEERWTNLLNGVDYTTRDGINTNWQGFVNDEKISPIANYVYWFYANDNVSNTTATGEANGQSENSTSVNVNRKPSKAWNEMVDMVRNLYEFLLSAKNNDGEMIYPEFDIHQVKPLKINVVR